MSPLHPTLPLMRRALRSDARTLIRWANDPEVISISLNRTGRIAWADHVRWLEARLEDPDTMIWIAEGRRAGPNATPDTPENIPIGYARAQRGPEGLEISIYLIPAERQRGHGAQMLNFASAELSSRWPSEPIIARILHENHASRQLFLQAGFRLVATLGDHLLYRHDPVHVPD